MKSEILQGARVVHGIPAGTTTSGNTPVDSAVINRLDSNNGAIARSALIVLNHGAEEVGTVDLTPTLYEGSTSSPATLVTLASAMPLEAGDAVGTKMYQVDLSGLKQYFKVRVTPASGSSGVIDISLDVILCDIDINPEATPATIYRK